jgi:hypothetical protein
MSTPCESARALAKQNSKCPQKAPELVFDLYPDAHRHLTCRKQRPNLIAVGVLGPHLIEPTDAHDPRETGRVVSIRFLPVTSPRPRRRGAHRYTGPAVHVPPTHSTATRQEGVPQG